MTPQVKSLLNGAAGLPSDQRHAYLSQNCDDPAIRAEVESLLQFATGTESVFDGVIRRAASSFQASQEPSPGDVLGAYRIESLIGRGGMGSVYLAKRSDGTFEQWAAVKVFPSSHGELLRERFHEERRILARLNHPNIARILDAGQQDSGLLWFVMEYVSGIPVDRFCNEHALSQRARLRLFLRICAAVRHAHENLIVHRDLKPANILVNALGEPKLLDFGIAKVIHPLHLNSVSTRLFTPEYASPEQLRGEAITPATDVYALGVILYLLLTGRTPHQTTGKAPLEIARLVTEEDAPPASRIRADIPRDLDAILRKALHRDTEWRYRSVEEFSSDIQRFLQGRPVHAVPESFTYRASRFLRRNAIGVTLATAASLVLLVSTVISVQQARQAQRRFDQVRHLSNVFLFDFERAIQKLPGSLEARRMVASTAQTYLEQLAAESRQDPELQREIAQAHERVADIYRRLQTPGANQSAISNLTKAYAIRTELGDGQLTNPQHLKEYIGLLSKLASRYHTGRNGAESAKWDEEATRLASAWLESAPDSPEALATARAAFLARGLRLETAGHATQATESMQQAIAFAERAHELQPADDSIARSLASAEYTLANLLLNLKRGPEALKHASRAVAVAEELYRRDPSVYENRAALTDSLSSQGIVNNFLAQSDPRHRPIAIQCLRRAHDMATQAMRDDAKDAGAKDSVIVHSHRLARSLTAMGQLPEAGAYYERAGQIAQELTKFNPESRRHWYLLAANQVNYGDLLLRQKRPGEARQALLSADAAFDRGLALDPLDAVLLELRASQLHALTQANLKLGDAVEAQRTIRQCVDLLNSMTRRDPALKDYVGDYMAMMALAKQLGVATP